MFWVSEYLWNLRYTFFLPDQYRLFPSITSFSYFLECQNPDFFSIFQLPIFAKPYRRTDVHQCRAWLLG